MSYWYHYERKLLRQHFSLACFAAGTIAILLSAIPLGLWATPKNRIYELSLIVGMALWLRFGKLPNLSSRVSTLTALVFSGGYALATFLLGAYSINHYIRIKGDFGVFIQSLYWTLHGSPLFNTMDGTSHLGVHSSFILFVLVPVYRAWRSPLVLILAQSLALGSAGFILFRIARTKLDDLSALILLLVFLLFPTYQYGFGDFYESSLAAPFVLLSIYGALEKKWTVSIMSGVILVTVKETFPLMLVFLGIYLIINKSYRVGIATSLASGFIFLVSMVLIIPWFRHRYAIFPTDFAHFSPYSAVLANPWLTLSVVFESKKIAYLLTLLPLSFGVSLLWIVAIPELAITLLSSENLTGGRFSTVTVCVLAVSCVLALRRFETKPRHTIVSVCLFVTMALVPLWLNSDAFTPVKGASELPILVQMVGESSVAAPYDVVGIFSQRKVAFDLNRNPHDVVVSRSEYIIVRKSEPYSANEFHLVWSGEVFELWRSP